MAKKKAEPIRNLGENEDKLVVQKSQPLQALWSSGITLPEFKILDVYLGRINSRDDEHRTVVLEKGEIEKALGVTKINQKDLRDRLKHLMGNVIEIPDKTVKRGFTLVTLFEEVDAEQDDDGLWQITLQCTQKAKKYFFNIEDLGYYRYKLRCIKNMTSRQTYIMFNYLEANRFRKSWEVSLDELRAILECQGKTYDQYKYFNDLVLKRIHKDITEKTECQYTYEPIKKGRSYVALKLTLKTLRDEIDENQMTIFDYIEGEDIPGEEQEELEIVSMTSEERQAYLKMQLNEAWKEELPLGWFNDDEIELIGELLYKIPEHVLPSDRYADLPQKRAMYVREKILTMKMYDKKQTIKNKFKYIEKILREDA